MADYLLGLWRGLTNDKIWQVWSSYNPIEGITSHAGYLDNQPLYDLLSSLFNDGKSVQKHVYVSANDAISGSYIPFALHDETKSVEYRVSAVVGSASMPFVFPPRNMSKFGIDALLIDGGSTWNNNMISAVQDCYSREGIDSPSQIDVDVMILDNVNTDQFHPDTSSKYEPLTM